MHLHPRVIIVTLVSSAAAFVLSRILWPISPAAPTPTGAQLPLFIGLSVLEALTFGAGVAFFAFGFPAVRRATTHVRALTWPLYLAIGWSLVSWWPHNNLHLANGDNLGGLLAIEYVFHVSLYVTALIVVWALVRETSARRASPQ